MPASLKKQKRRRLRRLGGERALAERLQAPALPAIEVGRISFPTDHPNFQGTLGVTITKVREQLDGHDLVFVSGAPVFRYHAWAEGPHLPAGTELVALNADPRGRPGDANVGDPAVSLALLAERVAAADRGGPPAAQSPPEAYRSDYPDGGPMTPRSWKPLWRRVSPATARA